MNDNLTESIHVDSVDVCGCIDMEFCVGMSPCGTRSTFLITGELADRVRERFGSDAMTPVYLIEFSTMTGYSEYTITSKWTDFTVQCGTAQRSFFNALDTYGMERENYSGVAALCDWLDGKNPPKNISSDY